MSLRRYPSGPASRLLLLAVVLATFAGSAHAQSPSVRLLGYECEIGPLRLSLATSAGDLLRVAQHDTVTIRVDGLKNPKLALLLNLFTPSIGHLYTGDYVAASAILLVTGAGAYLFFYRFLEPSQFDTPRPVLGMAMIFGAWLYGIVDAAPSAYRANRRIFLSNRSR